jgi:predicted patatin/cPLA2 family phospholipase
LERINKDRGDGGMHFENGALVLEGGGLRGIFTAGVLRRWMDDKLYFNYVIGVSMGACCAANYVSRQPERNRIVNTRFVGDRRYLSYRRLFAGGELFGMDFIFETIPQDLVPFDFAAFLSSPVRCVTVATDCETGDAVYFEKNDLGGDYLKVLRASSSLPFIAKPVPFRGRMLMDGGLADSVPVRHAVAEGHRKLVLVLTRPKGYRKKPSRLPGIFLRRYRKYPGIIRALENRHRVYNETADYIDHLESTGGAFVIRPGSALGAERVEKNKDKLYLAYDEGYARAAELYPGLVEYLAK